MRVHEVAKEVGINSKELLPILAKMGIQARSHMSTLDQSDANRALRQLRKASPAKTPPRSKKISLKKKAAKLIGDGPPQVESAIVKRSHLLIKKRVIQPEPEISETEATVQDPEVHAPVETVAAGTDGMEDSLQVLDQASPETTTPVPVAGEVETTEKEPEKKDPEVQSQKTAPPGKVVPEEDEKSGKKKKVKKDGKDEFDFRKDWNRLPDFQNFQRRHDRRRKTIRRSQTPGAAGITKPRRRLVKLSPGVTIREFSELIGQKSTAVISKLMGMGVMSTINQPMDMDAASLIAEEFGVPTEVVAVKTEEDLLPTQEFDEASTVSRPPVVTIMGHVDHGKTSLLDAIRETRVTEKEAGGITQHIGAYSVTCGKKLITFLDTPGHEAFTAMRARGAQVTDIVILVVAADDGVMPQTLEAINHCKVAGVPMIVAINKIDKPESNPDRIRAELAERELVPEDWGGQTIYCEISAKKKIKLDHLLEMILLQTEVMELKAVSSKPAQGVIVEAKLDQGRGPVATVLIQDGTLRTGDVFVSGLYSGRVRVLLDDLGNRMNEAGPSMPVEVIGCEGVPQAGDTFVVTQNDRIAREIANGRQRKHRLAAAPQAQKVSLEDVFGRIQKGVARELNLILKADVQGSVEVMRDAIGKLKSDAVQVKILHANAGGITESDVLLAAVSEAIIIGFNVKPDAKARAELDRQKVDVRLYTVIYDVISDVQSAMEGLLEPTLKEKVLGRAEIREVYRITRVGNVAGCYVLDGVMSRQCEGIRLIRDSVVVHEGELGSLKRFKDDVREVQSGFECGIGFNDFNDIKSGDIIEAYSIEKIAGKLSDHPEQS